MSRSPTQMIPGATVYDIVPVGKPRMTQSDRWKKRPAVMRYWAFKDEVQLKIKELPIPYHVIFLIEMPKSWSKKKRLEMVGTPHRSRPDKDNLEKALLDALYEDDSAVWDGRVTKLWGEKGQIIVARIHQFEVQI